MDTSKPARREFLEVAGAALATSLFTGNLKGANDRVAAAFIGMGRMGMDNLGIAMKQPNLQVVAVCDCYQPHLDEAVALAAKGGQKAKAVKDFREIIADKSVDVVCISTPDHWHAYMTVEACKAGKDVYVEKPLCTYVDEGLKMVEAARKYKRVVQAGTMQRSGDHFQKACEIVRTGQLGKVTFCRTWNTGNGKPDGYGNPPDSDPPPDLDWNMWLGPAPLRRFNANRWGVHPEMARKPFPYFRYFWDYAGGSLTDWGVHVLDIVHLAFNEPMPSAITTLGGKYWITDNCETPDTLVVTWEYPQGFLATYENRLANADMPLGQGYGTMFHGTKGTLYVNRSFYRVIPERGGGLEPVEVKSSNNSNDAHWANFLECIKTRQKPTSDIETCFRTTAACILGNVALRSRLRVDWDDKAKTVLQKEARRLLAFHYRKPWKLVV
jgi:predicted dehydrogenase